MAAWHRSGQIHKILVKACDKLMGRTGRLRANQPAHNGLSTRFQIACSLTRRSKGAGCMTNTALFSAVWVILHQLMRQWTSPTSKSMSRGSNAQSFSWVSPSSLLVPEPVLGDTLCAFLQGLAACSKIERFVNSQDAVNTDAQNDAMLVGLPTTSSQSVVFPSVHS